jgi:ABC-type multidrug transport system fused ATPase/permease subunit
MWRVSLSPRRGARRTYLLSSALAGVTAVAKAFESQRHLHVQSNFGQPQRTRTETEDSENLGIQVCLLSTTDWQICFEFHLLVALLKAFEVDSQTRFWLLTQLHAQSPSALPPPPSTAMLTTHMSQRVTHAWRPATAACQHANAAMRNSRIAPSHPPRIAAATPSSVVRCCCPSSSSSSFPSIRSFHSARRLSAAPASTPAKEGDPSKLALTLQHLTKRFAGSPGRILFKDLNLSFYHGAKIGILGANGCGKSSFLKILAGIDKEIDGAVSAGRRCARDRERTAMDDAVRSIAHS